jgi:glycosyltransferase involved in cell wall biosynthesis
VGGFPRTPPTPRVSAVIPVYNQQEPFLREAIESVLAQTDRDFELIVVDDGSTNATPDVIASYGNRLRGFRKPNGGVSSALNLAIRESRGEWIAWLSSDDLWEPNKLARQLGGLREKPSVGLVYSDALLIDSDGRVVGRRSFPPPPTKRRRLMSLVRGCYVNGCSTLVRREVFDDVGPFDERDRLTPDYDMWLRIAERYEFLHIPEPLVRYRVHPGQTSVRREAVERAGRRVAFRAILRMDRAWGAFATALRLKDQIASLPWQAKRTGGGFSLANRLAALMDFARLIVNPEAP